MIFCYESKTDPSIIQFNLGRIQGQIFRLLPANEEGQDWIKPLETLLVELYGLNNFLGDQENVLTLISKLEGLKAMGEDVDFYLFRRTIFEACSLVGEIKEHVTRDTYL